MTPDLRWYAARAAAMSPAELAWRAGRGARIRALGRFSPAGPPARLDDGPWRAAVLALAEPEREAVVRAAARIADGELSLWGRRVDVEAGRPAWDADPLGGGSWANGAWRGTGRDPKPVWELHRQQHLVPLAAGAALAGRVDWARLVVEQALDWTQRNPRGEGIAWASGYEAAHRLVTWAFALPLVAAQASAVELERLGSAFAEHRAFVAARPSRFSSANNHRLAELAGLLAGSLLTPERPGWDRLWAELEREASRQTYADGGSREQAAGYFLYVLEILWVCAFLARAAEATVGRIGERLEAMLGWLSAVARIDGEPPRVGDDAEDRLLRLDYFEPRHATAIAARVARLLGAPWREAATESVLLAESGYVVIRARSTRVVMDVGELGFGSLAAHGHADALSVLVDRGTEPLLRDTGSASYVEGRDADRATDFHNTVVVEGRSQAEPLGPHLWGRRYTTSVEASALGPDLDYVRASHDGYGAARHTRSVTRVGDDLLVVLDRITAPRPVRADLVWQPGPALPDGPAVASHPAVAREELPGRYSPRYTWAERARRLVWPARGTDVVFASAVPLDDGSAPDLHLERRRERAVVEVRGRRVVEDWTSPRPEVA